jgi:hypothetical protein
VVTAQVTNELVPVHRRHLEVRDHEVRPVSACQLQGPRGIGRLEHTVAHASDDGGQHVSISLAVVDHEYTTHGSFFGGPDLSPIVPSGEMAPHIGWLPMKEPLGRADMESVAGQVAALQGDHLLLKLEDGHEVLAPSCDLGDVVEVGNEVLVYLDERRRLLGWYLPRSEIGVDLRDWKEDT